MSEAELTKRWQAVKREWGLFKKEIDDVINRNAHQIIPSNADYASCSSTLQILPSSAVKYHANTHLQSMVVTLNDVITCNGEKYSFSFDIPLSELEQIVNDLRPTCSGYCPVSDSGLDDDDWQYVH